MSIERFHKIQGKHIDLDAVVCIEDYTFKRGDMSHNITGTEFQVHCRLMDRPLVIPGSLTWNKDPEETHSDTVVSLPNTRTLSVKVKGATISLSEKSLAEHEAFVSAWKSFKNGQIHEEL